MMAILIILLLDIVAFFVSLFLGIYTDRIFLSNGSEIVHFFYFLIIKCCPFIPFIFFIGYEGLYTKRLPFWEETKSLIKASTIATLIIFALTSLSQKVYKVSELEIVFLWVYSLFIFPLFRYIGKFFLHKLGIWRENILIIGAGNAGKSVAKELEKDIYLGYNLVGFLDDDPRKQGKKIQINNKEYKVLGKIDDVADILKESQTRKVIIAIPSLPKEKLCNLVNHVREYTKEVFVVPELKGIPALNAELHYFFMEQIFLLKINNNLKSWFNQFLKRSFDLVISLSLLPFLLPIFGIIGILIKLDSEGSIFFTHSRVGKDGKAIKVLKFRSMYKDAQKRLEEILEKDPNARKEWEETYKLKNDPRITRVGKFLRKTSLDELPQIFNVIKGDMSLVGPRPVIEEELEKYYKDFAKFYYMVKPGITGLWQVSGRSDTDYNFRVKLDTWYVLNWSLWLDIVILFKTIKVVLKGEGAY